ncbi:MAG: acyloxyacyl hydrolase [Gemmatimonadota bacterium]|nr:acyloxyacyl hydrolase [Gemmatimonadota bacterium]
MRTLVPLYALLSLAPAVATAQTSPDARPRPAERLLGGWIAASVAPSTRFGYISDRRFFVAALRAQYLLDTFGPLALASTFDVVPIAILSNTPTYEAMNVRGPDSAMVRFKYETGRAAVFGAGIVPAGFQLYTLSAGPARFFLGASAGVLWFTRDTPIPDARRMNFAVDMSGGVEVLARDGRAVVVGYKFQHLSNGGTAFQNPGFDAHLLYVGLLRRRGRVRTGQEEATVAR